MEGTNVVRTRYAPSPTGHLHIGGARTALFCYLLAKKTDGKFIVRIEDTDQERNVAGAEEEQLANLQWLGIAWDESVDVGGPYGPYRSMERLDTYETYLQRLADEGKTYPCYCTKEELDEAREAQLKRGEMPRYSGRCRHLSAAERQQFEAEGRKPVTRFRVPAGQAIVVDDLVRGRVTFESDGIGDFVIARADGRPMYNFAVTVDDALMKITHVIRGEEHLSNTPLQILLYEALGFPVPHFAHLSLILNRERQKMSKRDESIVQFVNQYRQLGYLPQAIVNFLALLGWSPPGEHSEEEVFSREQLAELFSLDRLSKAPAVFDPDKLNWLNNHYIKAADLDDVVALCTPHLEAAGLIAAERTAKEDEWVRRLVALYQEQLKYGAEIVELAELFFQQQLSYGEEAKEVLIEEHVLDVLQELQQQLNSVDSLTSKAFKQAMKATQKATGQKGKKLFMPVRAALTGSVHGPDLGESVALIGREKVLARLQWLIDNYAQTVAK